jgi:hypothetical protein
MEIKKLSAPLSIACFATTIWDESLYKVPAQLLISVPLRCSFACGCVVAKALPASNLYAFDRHLVFFFFRVALPVYLYEL